MSSIVEIIKRDSVEEMEAFFARHPKAYVSDYVQETILECDSINLFDHYGSSGYIGYVAYKTHPKISKLIHELGLDTLSYYCEMILETGTLADIKALIEEHGKDFVSAGMGVSPYASNPHPEVFEFYLDNFRARMSWGVIAEMSTPEIAEIWRRASYAKPSLYETRLALRSGNILTYRYICETFDIRLRHSRKTSRAYCQGGEESDIRSHWMPLMACVIRLWRRGMWKLAEELLNGFVPDTKIIQQKASHPIGRLNIMKGLMYMGWNHHIRCKKTLEYMFTMATSYGYWPWFAKDSRKIGVFHRKKDILV